MSQYIITDTTLTGIADAIRSKNGSSDTYTPLEMPDAIEALPSGIEEEDDAEQMDAHLVSGNIGEAYLYTGESTTKYKNDRLYIIDDVPNYLCFTANEAGSTVALYLFSEEISETYTLPIVEYSTDLKNWTNYVINHTESTPIVLTNAGDKVYFRGDNDHFSYFDGEEQFNFVIFDTQGSIAVSGNIMSLLDKTCQMTTIPQNSSGIFACLFCPVMTGESSAITSAPELPATTLAYGCYVNMFGGCTSLTTAPKLPATILAENCYTGMFQDCTSLITAPELPATTLAEDCYDGMLLYCTSLQVNDSPVSGVAEQAWTIPTSGTFRNTYSQSNMFSDCAGTRSSDNMSGTQGQSYTYYTQNTPI